MHSCPRRFAVCLRYYDKHNTEGKETGQQSNHTQGSQQKGCPTGMGLWLKEKAYPQLIPHPSPVRIPRCGNLYPQP